MAGRLFRICGLVQGVGFRPHVWRLAQELGLDGWVRNDGDGVIAAVNGENWPKFAKRLRDEAPRLARIDAVDLLDERGHLRGVVLDGSAAVVVQLVLREVVEGVDGAGEPVRPPQQLTALAPGVADAATALGVRLEGGGFALAD